jgi:hypothetical protein
MIQQGGQIGEGEWVMVRRRGVVHVADTAIQAFSASALARRRSDTMIGLAATAAGWRADAEVEVEEPDGAKWSLKITVKDSTR